MITFEQKGNFKRLNGFLERFKEVFHSGDLNKYGEMGVEALKNATPKDSGETANSWYYKIERVNDSVSINFYNSNVVNGCNIAIVLQYGHGTKSGSWVEGVDYINPALEPIFRQIANDAWKEAR